MTLKEQIKKLETGELTSVDLLFQALKKHEACLSKNAIAMISPLAYKMALERDEERRKGIVRSPLHGIPIVIKDNILYKDFTPTTANAFAFHDLVPPFNASIVDRLIEKGVVILGKANLSEFAYFMSYDNMPSGYGSMYGQVKHPFDESVDPLGSSTGSAVAVKLGIVPLSVGSETNGSLMAPAYRTQIVSIKPSFGYVSKHGIIPISPSQDTAGPMALSVYDAALLLDILAFEDEKDQTTQALKRPKSFLEYIDEPIKEGKVGFIFIKGHTYTKEDLIAIEKSKSVLKRMGLETLDIEIEYPKTKNDSTMLYEFKASMNAFIKSLNGATKRTSLKDIIEFNEANKERCLRYGQSILTAAENTSGDLNDPVYLAYRKTLLEEFSLFETLIETKGLLALTAPLWMGFAPIYGNPSINVPAGIIDGVIKSMVFVGKKYEDSKLIQLCHQFEMHKHL